MEMLASFSKGAGYSKNDLLSSGTPIILYGRLYTKYETNITIVDTFVAAKSGSIYSRGGEVIVPASGETAEDISIAAVVENKGVILGGDLNIITPGKDLDPTFLALTISFGNAHKELSRFAQGKSVVHLHNADLKIADISYPKCKEQQKIGAFFQTLDRLITLHQCNYFFNATEMVSRNVEKTFSWEQRKLGDIAIFNPKSELPEKFEYVDLESVVGTEIIAHREEQKSTAPSRAQRLAQFGDLFYQTVRPYQKNNCLFESHCKSYVFSTGYAQIRPFFNGYFLLSLVQSDFFVKRVLDRCTGTSYPAINSNDLAEMSIKKPCDKKEIEKIGQFFRSLDRLITLHQRECFFSRIRKKLKITSQKTNAWEQRKVNEIADIVGGGTPSTHNPSYWDGDINWYAPAEMEGKRYAVTSERKITQAGLSNSSAKILPAGRTILFTSRAGIGKVAILQHDAATNQGFQSLVLKDGISPYFIYSMGSILKKKAEGIASGSTFLEISGKMLGNIDITIPISSEQHIIADFFRNLEDLITLHQRERLFLILEEILC